MIGFALREGWRNFRNIGIIGLLNISSLTVTLILVGTALHGYLVVESWRSGLLGKFEIEAFLSPDVDSLSAVVLIDSISRFEKVNSLRYISQAEAAERFEEQFGEEVFDLLGYNPLPPSLVITLDEDADPSITWKAVADGISELEMVEEVVFEGDILAKVESFYRRAGSIAGIIIAVMLVVSLTFTILTVLSSINAREQFIRVVAMSGGSRAMAQGPFIAMGGYYGLVAAVFAIGVVSGIKWLLLVGWGAESVVRTWWIPGIIGLGLLIGIVGAGWAAGRRIKLS